MADRDGTLSSFPASLDQFAIKKPFNSSLPLSQQDVNALEQALHFNHMFDAMYNMETYILNGSGGLGGVVVSRWANGVAGANVDVHGANLKLGFTTLSMTMTGNTISVTAMIPSAFGEDPFHAKGFAVAHNLYVTNLAGSANTEGIWANQSWSNDGPFNQMLSWFQFFTLIRPVSGRKYEVTVKNFPFHSTSESVTPTFTDPMKQPTEIRETSIHLRSGWGGDGNGGLLSVQAVAGSNAWSAFSERGDDPRWGWAWSTRLGDIADSYVEWGEINYSRTNFEIGSNEAYARLGPMVRASGTKDNCSFYCIALGDIPGKTASGTAKSTKYGRILKVVGGNITDGETGTTNGGGLNWKHGTAAPFGVGSTSSTGYFRFDHTNTRFRLLCETVPGSAKITVQSAPAPYVSWSTLYGPFYDGESPLLTGYSGLFSQAMDGDAFRHFRFRGGVTVGSLADVQLPVDVQLMYMLISPEDNLTMEAGT